MFASQSNALLMSVKLQSSVSSCCVASDSAVHHASCSFQFNISILSAHSRKRLNAATLLLSVSSSVHAKSIHESLSVLSHDTSSGSVSTGQPKAFARSHDQSARLSSIFLVAVPALLASKPASVRTPKRDVTSSSENQKAFAIGQASTIAVENFSKSKALFANAFANTSLTFQA